jgi:hypothetical protein
MIETLTMSSEAEELEPADTERGKFRHFRLPFGAVEIMQDVDFSHNAVSSNAPDTFTGGTPPTDTDPDPSKTD